MQIYDLIAEAQSGRAIANLAAAADVPEDQLDAALRSVVADMSLAIERNTLSRGGFADLVKALGDGHHQVILDTPGAINDPHVAADGTEILDHLFGSSNKSRAVAARAAQASGLSEGVIKMLLPFLAQMLMGAIAKWAKGGFGDILQKLPGGQPGPPDDEEERPQPRGRQRRGGGEGGGGGFELPRSETPPGRYPMPPMPGEPEASPRRGQEQQRDRDDDDGGFQIPWPRRREDRPTPSPFPFPFPRGNDEQNPPERQQRERDRSGGGGGGFDLPRTPRPEGGYKLPPISTDAGSDNPGSDEDRSPRRAPQPPSREGDNPFGDLSDIIRHGGKVEGTQAGPKDLRDILGGLLGFGGKGIFGWLIRLLVMRLGWSFLKRLLGRMLLGR